MKQQSNRRMSAARMWLLVWGLGLVAQICWNLENMWFNSFVYAKIGKDPSIIMGMMICSALATTFSTFFFGTWSDRTGNRRTFISVGYIIWGIFTIAFGCTEFIPKQYYTLAAVMVVLADTVMSFFGSMANDSTYNAWTNDIMTDENRGQIGAALGTLPILGTLLGTLLGAQLVGTHDNYMRLFLVIGGAVSVFGIISLFLMHKSDDVAPSKRGTFWHQFGSVFNFKEFGKRHELVLVFLSLMVFFIAYDAISAQLNNYLIYYLGFNASKIGVIEAVPMVVAMLAAIPSSRAINHNKHFYVALAGVIALALACFLAAPIHPDDVNPHKFFNGYLWLCVLLLTIGNIVFVQVMRVWAKQLYPKDSRGQFEGIWILFFVLFPMIGGGLISNGIVRTSGEIYHDELSGQIGYVPNGNLFLVAGIIVLLTIIPLVFAKRQFDKRVNEG